jgi:molybdopterin-guanine dinucleotide biosynthesis protein A
MKNITVYILAGGKSSRMGTDKGLLLLNGKPMIQHVIDTVLPLTSSISIVSNNEEYKTFGFPVVSDLIKDKGPVVGIYTALSDSTTETNLILSCDTPFVSLKLIRKLIENSSSVDVCIPSFKGRIHPLIGVYKKNNTTVFKNCLESDILKLMIVNQKLNTLIVNMEELHDESEFTNLNTKTDLEASFSK